MQEVWGAYYNIARVVIYLTHNRLPCIQQQIFLSSLLYVAIMFYLSIRYYCPKHLTDFHENELDSLVLALFLPTISHSLCPSFSLSYSSTDVANVIFCSSVSLTSALSPFICLTPPVCPQNLLELREERLVSLFSVSHNRAGPA